MNSQENNPNNVESRYCECGNKLTSETERIDKICEDCKWKLN